jgi:hypothetical protein
MYLPLIVIAVNAWHVRLCVASQENQKAVVDEM